MTFPTFDQWVNYLGFAIGFFGICFALVQYNEKRKLTEYVRANNWFTFQRMDNVNGMVQKAKRLYLEKFEQLVYADLLDTLSMADAHGQELLKEAIRQIQMSEPSFTSDDFTRWEREGKINEDKVALFKRFAVDPDAKKNFRIKI